MIFIDLKYINQSKTYDMKVDENVLVIEILKELESYLGFDHKKAVLISKNRKEVLECKKTLLSQDVLGGDTLILIVREEADTSE